MPEEATDISGWLRNAQKMCRLYPDTFEAPDAKRRASIEPEFMIKLCDIDGQRFWTEVVSCKRGMITARVANDTGCENRKYGNGQIVRYGTQFAYTVHTPQESARHTFSYLMSTGQLPVPTSEQQRARSLARYIEEHWHVQKDMFHQGVADSELAIISHVDNTMIRAHFEKNPTHLQACGLSIEDWDVAYILNFEELAQNLGVERTDPVLQLCYQRPANITLAPKLVCLAYNEEF